MRGRIPVLVAALGLTVGAAPATAETQIGGPAGVAAFPILADATATSDPGRRLVAWAQLDTLAGAWRGRVYARPIAPDGRPLGPAQLLSSDADPPPGSTGAGGAASILRDTRRDRFLVVWQSHRQDPVPCPPPPPPGNRPPGSPETCSSSTVTSVARFVDGAGRPLGDLTALALPGTEGSSGAPSGLTLTYNARSDRFLGVYLPLEFGADRQPTATGLTLQAFDPSARPLGKPRVLVPQRKRSPVFGMIVANPRSGENLVVYTSGSVIRAKPLDAKGRPLPGPGDILVSGPGSRTSYPPIVRVDPVTGDYLVLWSESGGGRTMRMVSRVLTPTGRLKGPRVVVDGRGSMNGAPDPGGAGWLLSWSSMNGGDVVAVRTAPNGVPASEPFTVTTGAPMQALAPLLVPLDAPWSFTAVWSSAQSTGVAPVLMAGRLAAE